MNRTIRRADSSRWSETGAGAARSWSKRRHKDRTCCWRHKERVRRYPVTLFFRYHLWKTSNQARYLVKGWYNGGNSFQRAQRQRAAHASWAVWHGVLKARQADHLYLRWWSVGAGFRCVKYMFVPHALWIVQVSLVLRCKRTQELRFFVRSLR